MDDWVQRVARVRHDLVHCHQAPTTNGSAIAAAAADHHASDEPACHRTTGPSTIR
jgi:hypothetical protein